MKNENNYQLEQNPESTEVLAAQLAFLGATLSTIGDGISALATGNVLQGLERSNNQDSQNQSDQSKKLESMQKQIEQLTRKVERMERRKK